MKMISRISNADTSPSFGDDYDFKTMFDTMVCTFGILIYFTCNATVRIKKLTMHFRAVVMMSPGPQQQKTKMSSA